MAGVAEAGGSAAELVDGMGGEGVKGVGLGDGAGGREVRATAVAMKDGRGLEEGEGNAEPKAIGEGELGVGELENGREVVEDEEEMGGGGHGMAEAGCSDGGRGLEGGRDACGDESTGEESLGGVTSDGVKEGERGAARAGVSEENGDGRSREGGAWQEGCNGGEGGMKGNEKGAGGGRPGGGIGEEGEEGIVAEEDGECVGRASKEGGRSEERRVGEGRGGPGLGGRSGAGGSGRGGVAATRASGRDGDRRGGRWGGRGRDWGGSQPR